MYFNATLGGAIADASAIDCIFIGNHANGYGGAVFIGEDGFEINNCTFINNTAKYGGALAKSWNDRRGSSIPKQNIFQVKVYNSTFINNTALNDSVVFDPEMFYWNVEEGEFITGGAVFLEECGCDISGCLFENNQANGYGGVHLKIVLQLMVKATILNLQKIQMATMFLTVYLMKLPMELIILKNIILL